MEFKNTDQIRINSKDGSVGIGSVSNCHLVEINFTPTTRLVLPSKGFVGIGFSETRIMFAVGQKIENCPHWTNIKVPSINDTYYDRSIVTIDDTTVICRLVKYKIVVSPAKEELEALLASWRERGFDRQADRIEYGGEDGDVWDYFEKRVKDGITEVRYLLADCEFYDRHVQSPSVRLSVECDALNIDPGMKLDINPHLELWTGNGFGTPWSGNK
jgi:hypothetical protein